MTNTKNDLETLLVATDFSVAAEAALDVAIGLAREVRAKVHVVHAFELPYVGFSDSVSFPISDLAERIRARAETDLAACVAKRSGTGVEVVARLEEGDPREAVVEAAQELAADLVIMGTHGRRGLPRALIGSVAESVVRTCARPVMVVRVPRPVAGPFVHILVATDFSEPSRRALDVALDLARMHNARISLLHVWSLPKFGYAEALTWPIAELESAARGALGDLLASTTKVHARTEALLRQGNESTQILETAEKSGCDLVVMGTHGRRGLPRLMLGSVAGEVIRRSPVPVITVGHPPT